MMEFNQQTTTEELEDLKDKFEQLKADIEGYIQDKFDDIFTAIDGRIEELEDEAVEYEDEEYEDEELEESIVQERLNVSLLSQQIASQLQTVGSPIEESNNEEDLPVVEVVADSTPAPSLTELIKSQVSTTPVVEAASVPAPSLADQIAKQVDEQANLAVVAPATSEGPVEIPEPAETPARPMNAIIEELRSSVNAEVETTSVEETDQLVEQVVSTTPGIDSDHSSDLAQQIRTQLVSNEIKKQLS